MSSKIKNKKSDDTYTFNLYAYIYYIVYVCQKPEDECDGIELYVRNKVYNNDASFIPI